MVILSNLLTDNKRRELNRCKSKKNQLNKKTHLKKNHLMKNHLMNLMILLNVKRICFLIRRKVNVGNVLTNVHLAAATRTTATPATSVMTLSRMSVMMENTDVRKMEKSVTRLLQ